MIKEPKKFNAKYAENDDHYEGLSNFEGIQIIDPDEIFRDLQEDESAKSKSGPINTYSPTTIKRPPQKNEILRKPSEWMSKARELISRPSRNKRTKGKQREDYKTDNENNKIGMAANYAYIDRLVRESDAYKCPECRGAKHGGRPSNSLNFGNSVCKGCGNTGSTLIAPEQSIFNITEHARKFNEAITYHENNCGTGTNGEPGCKPQCKFKDAIDRNVRRGAAGKKLKKQDTHRRSGSSDFIEGLMRPQSTVDDYKGFAPVLQRVRGHEDEPLRMGDAVHVMNIDTINPDSNITKGDGIPHYFKETYETPEGGVSWGKTWTDAEGKNRQNTAEPQGRCEDCGKGKFDVNHITVQRGVHDEGVYGEGGRDKQMSGIVHRVLPGGTHADVFVYYRPIEGVRQERSQRINGRPDKNISMIDPSDIDERSSMVGINRTEEPNPAKRAVTNDIEQAYTETLPMTGERSPLRSRGIWKLHRDVPLSSLGRLSPVTAPLLATSGVIKRTMPKKSLIGVANQALATPTHCDHCWNRKGATGCAGASPDISEHCPNCTDHSSGLGKHVSDKRPAESRTQTNTVHRIDLGLDTESIANMHENSPDLETKSEARILQKNLDTRAQLPEGHPSSVYRPIKGEEVAEQHRKVQPADVKPITFNSGLFDENDEDNLLGKPVMPKPEVPDSLPIGDGQKSISEHGEKYDF